MLPPHLKCTIGAGYALVDVKLKFEHVQQVIIIIVMIIIIIIKNNDCILP